MNTWRAERFTTALLLVATVSLVTLIYGSGFHTPFVCDDWPLLFDVSQTHRLTDLDRFVTFQTSRFVRATQWLVTWCLYQFVGARPMPFHALSLVLNLMNAILLGLLAYRLLQEDRRGSLMPAAVLVAAIFLFSWRHHEAVYWYAANSELLAAFFRLAAMVMYAHLLTARTRTRAILLGAAVSCAFTIAVLSKENAIILPLELVLLLTFDHVCQRRPVRAVEIAPLGLCALIAAVWLHEYVDTSTIAPGGGIERAGITIIHSSPVNLILRAVQFFNGNFLGTGFLSRNAHLLGLELCGLAFVCTLAWWRRRRLWLFALSWTAVTVAPYAVLTSTDAVALRVPVLLQGVAADRWLYYPAAGASLLMVASLRWVSESIEKTWAASSSVNLVKAALWLTLVLYIAASAHKLWKFGAGWHRAGQSADSIVRQVRAAVPSPQAGTVLCAVGLPDSIDGKYVFRSGFTEAMYLAYGRHDFAIREAVQTPAGLPPRDFDDSACSKTVHYNDDEQTISVSR